jgi:diacylglycerol kinase (ATP)
MKNKFLEAGEPGYHPFRKIKIMLFGLRYAVLHDFSVLYKLLISGVVLGLSIWLHAWVDAAVVLLATGVVLSAELLNTTIEALCDLIDPDYNQKIHIIKSIAAAAVGIVILTWLIVLGVEFAEIWNVLTSE